MTDEFPTLRLDASRRGIIRFDDDPTAGILAGIKAAEIVKRCNEYEALASRAHAAESQLAAMAGGIENWCARCGATSPNSRRCGRCDGEIIQRVAPNALSSLPERAKAWMGLREAAFNVADVFRASSEPRDWFQPVGKLMEAQDALRALETGNG